VCYVVQLSLCPLNFVFAISRKPMKGFWWNLVQTVITMSWWVLCMGDDVPLFLKELWPMGVFLCQYSFFAISPQHLGEFLWNLVQRKMTMCICAFCKGSAIPQFLMKLWSLEMDFVFCLWAFFFHAVDLTCSRPCVNKACGRIMYWFSSALLFIWCWDFFCVSSEFSQMMSGILCCGSSLRSSEPLVNLVGDVRNFMSIVGGV
jgi:hypothetical protein